MRRLRGRNRELFERDAVFIRRGEPGGVRLAEVDREREGLCLAGQRFKGPDRVVACEVRREAGLLRVVAIDLEDGIPRRAAAVEEAGEVVVSLQRRVKPERRTEMPFADEGGGVAPSWRSSIQVTVFGFRPSSGSTAVLIQSRMSSWLP